MTRRVSDLLYFMRVRGRGWGLRNPKNRRWGREKVGPERVNKNSLSMVRIARRGLSFHSGRLEAAARCRQRPEFEPATKPLRSNPSAPGTLRPPTWTLSRIVPAAISRCQKTRIIRWGMRLTSTVFESKGSFQAGLSQPTLAERSVRLRYLGVISRGYWDTPLSTPSIPSTNS